MKSMIVLFLIGTFFTVGLQALQCYRCGVLSSDPNFQAGDDAICSSTQTSQMNTCNTTGLLAQCMTSKAANIVVQLTCSDACLEVNYFGSGTWCCKDKDLCNAAPTSTLNMVAMVSTVILSVMSTYHL